MIAYANAASAAEELDLIRQISKPYGFEPKECVLPDPVGFTRLAD